MKARVSKIDILSVNIPFRMKFRHSSASRDVSESIFVRIELDSGETGFGESLPRRYVTGEDQASVMDDLKRVLPGSTMGRAFDSFEEVIDFCGYFQDLAGASKCAHELALLDVFGRYFNRPVSDALNGPKNDRISYSAAIGGDSVFNTALSAFKYRLYGIRDIKLKVGDGKDLDRLKAVRRFGGKDADVRIDANCAWGPDEAIEKLTVMRDYNFSVIEQPVKKEDIDSLKKVSDAIPEPVMADESLCDLKDARALAVGRICDMFNIRISKCGGILDSLKIAGVADSSGISYQLGCQVGESGVLSAAGRHFATCVKGVRYMEGSYARYLLESDVTAESVDFGYGGLAGPIEGPGLGVTVDEKILNRYVTDRVSIR